MTTLQSLQNSRQSSVTAVFKNYAKRQICALYCNYPVEDVKKFVSKIEKDTKDFSLCLTSDNSNEELSYTKFASVPTSINIDGKVTKRTTIYSFDFTPKSFADVDKVISYYIDNYAVLINTSLAFREELRQKEIREQQKKEKKEREQRITELQNKLVAYFMQNDIERANEIKAEIEQLSK